MLKGIVLFVVLSEIQSFCFYRDAFAGIITKLPALTLGGNDTLFDAKNLLLIYLRAMHAVCAGLFNFSAKQHILTP